MKPVSPAQTRCPICASDDACELYSVFDDRYAYPGVFSLRECRSCHHARLEPPLSAERLEELYTKYYPRSKMTAEAAAGSAAPPAKSGFREWLDGDRSSAYHWARPGTRVLDIGCGFGESLEFLKARGCEAYGIEADANVREVAAKKGLDIKIGLFRAGLYPEGFFDTVLLNQVVEHTLDPVQTLREVSQVLKTGGQLVITTPNRGGWGARAFGSRWINWHAPYHTQFFSKVSLAAAARSAGFELVESRTVTSSEWLHYQWIHLLFFPKEGQPSVFWSMPPRRTLPQKLVFKALRLVHRAYLDHALTRAFDAAGLGDNFLFVLRKS